MIDLIVLCKCWGPTDFRQLINNVKMITILSERLINRCKVCRLCETLNSVNDDTLFFLLKNPTENRTKLRWDNFIWNCTISLDSRPACLFIWGIKKLVDSENPTFYFLLLHGGLTHPLFLDSFLIFMFVVLPLLHWPDFCQRSIKFYDTTIWPDVRDERRQCFDWCVFLRYVSTWVLTWAALALWERKKESCRCHGIIPSLWTKWMDRPWLSSARVTQVSLQPTVTVPVLDSLFLQCYIISNMKSISWQLARGFKLK